MSIFSLLRKSYCNDWQKFHFILTRTLMLNLQVYFAVTFADTVSAELGEGLGMWCSHREVLNSFFLFLADVHLNAFLLLNAVFQKCVFSCRETVLHTRYTTTRSPNQTPMRGKEDIPKVQGKSQATVFSFLKLWIASTCLFVYLHIKNSYLKQNWRMICMMHGLLYSYTCCSSCFGFAVLNNS